MSADFIEATQTEDPCFSDEADEHEGKLSIKLSSSSPLLSPHDPSCGSKWLICYTDLPEWRQHNPYIRSGYRVQCETYAACFRSWFFYHNEVLNIWSHALGLIAFLIFWGVTYGHTIWDPGHGASEGNYIDGLIFAPFLVGATLCLLISTLYHTFEPCGEHISLGWAKADYVGIVVLIWGSFFPVIHYLFFCKIWIQLMYLGIITVLSIVCVCISVFNYFAKADLHVYRACLFSFLGLSGIVPILHFVATHNMGGEQMDKIYYLMCMGLFYLTGAFFYATRIPERFFPDSCTNDVLLSSHFIFHMLIIGGAVCHWMGSVYDFRHTQQCDHVH